MFDIKTYKVDDDVEVMKIIDKDELSPYTVVSYLGIIKQFSKCIGKAYSDIVYEVKELQRDKIVGNDIIRYNPQDSLINDYIHKYKNYLISNGNKNSTVNIKIKQLMLLLRKSNIEVPKIKYKHESKQSKVRLITTEDIKFVLNNSNIHHQALITFMASTGIRRYDAVHKFKIEDFIEACSDYTDAVFLDDFLETVKPDMIPYFEFIPNKTKKTGLPCKVCCSTEASNLIIQSIKKRIESIESHNKRNNTDFILTEESALFASKKRNYIGKLSEDSVTNMFFIKNKLLVQHKQKELDKELKNHLISKKEWKFKKDNFPRFHPHSLRHRFISTIRAYTTNRDISLLMEGHASSINTDKFYVGESEDLFNKESIRQTYMEVMPYLTFFEYIDPLSRVKENSEKDELRKEIEELKKKINKFEEAEKYLREHDVLNILK